VILSRHTPNQEKGNDDVNGVYGTPRLLHCERKKSRFMRESSAPHPTLTQWITNPQLRVFTTSESLGWNKLSLFLELHEAVPDSVTVPYLEDDIFGLILEGSAREYCID
jgi:hypothetical protein